jgi:threonine dehydratase
MNDEFVPSVAAIRTALADLGTRIRTTPVWWWRSQSLDERISGVQVQVKMELLQRSGSFKIRGALLNAMSLDAEQRARGVTGVSAGNHAIALAMAAQSVGASAKVVMPETADPFRVERCRNAGGEIISVPDVHQCFEIVQRIQEEEGRAFIHPFEGELTLTGTATVAMEWMEQVERLDAVIIPVGGGGLAGGMSAALKQLRPEIKVYGVEPVGADSMSRSFDAGSPQAIERVATIADSLGAPHAAPLSFNLCRRYLDDLVTVDDDDLLTAMRLLHSELKLAVEPACAAATAALLGPLAARLQHQRVGILLCGSNISAERWSELMRTA